MTYPKTLQGICLVLCAGVLSILWSCGQPLSSTSKAKVTQSDPITPIFGYHPDSFHIDQKTISANEFFAEILLDAKLTYSEIHELVERTDSVFDPRRIRAGKDYCLLYTDSCSRPDLLIYELSPYSYLEYDLQCLEVNRNDRIIQTKLKQVGGRIESSLWLSLKDLGAPTPLIAKMEDALAWSVDFYYIQPQDSFYLLYEEQWSEGQKLGVGRLLGAYFESGGQSHRSIWYESENYRGYFDPEGRPMKKAFLKSPVSYSRISSRYNPRRFHPIQKRVKPHLGTDYAAPRGTPIRAVADGTVTKASYTRGNGVYVKIRHDKTYETQYLHMTRYAKGISPGTRVSQGQTIGYVGSTGLATGPHVCFRFWKNGSQVDHLRENLPPPEPMSEEELPEYYSERDRILQLMTPDQKEGFISSNLSVIMP